MDSFMEPESIPIYGVPQPGYGASTALRYAHMGRKGTKKTPVDTHRLMRSIVGDNVKRYMLDRYKALPNESAMMKALATKANVSPETIRRIITRGVGASIDTIEDIAKVLHVPAPKLFVAGPEMREALSVSADDQPAGSLQRYPGLTATR